MEERKTTGEPKKGERKSRRRWLWAGAGVLIASLAVAIVILQSAWFGETLRMRLVAAMEKATGDRVELQGFSFNWRTLQVDLRGLAIHGREAAGDPPLFSADLIETGWKIQSFWGLRADLRTLRIWNPLVSVIFRGDGSPNVSGPGGRNDGQHNEVAQALALRVGRLEVLRGQVHFENRSKETWAPIDFRAENVHLVLESEPGASRYAGKLDFQKGSFSISGSDTGAEARPSQLSPTGRAKFRLYPQRAEIESLELRTAGSRLSAEGTIEDFRSPRLQFHYDVSVDWKEAAAFLGRSGWRGEMSSKGEGSYNDQGWQFTGPLEARAAETGIPSLPSFPWSGRANMRFTGGPPQPGGEKPQRWKAELDGIDVATLGGRFKGKATVERVARAAIAAGAGVIATPVATHLELRAEHISVPVLLSVQKKLPAPISRPPWAGSVSGPTEISFTGLGSDFTSRIEWQVEPAPVVPAGFTSVSGILRARYQAGGNRIEIDRSYLNVGQSHLEADGWLDDGNSRLNVKIDAPRWEEWNAVAEMISKRSAPLPVALHGRVTAGFLWTGGIASPVLNGNLRLAEFDFRKMHWDSFSGEFDYRGSNPAKLRINSGRLVRNAAAVDFNANLEVTNGGIAPKSPMMLHASVHDIRIEELGEMAGVRVPVRGMMEGSLDASGTLEDPRGRVNLSVGAGDAYGETFDRLSAQVSLESGAELKVRQFRLQKAKGTVEGDLSIGLKSQQLRFSLAGAGLALEGFQFLRSRFDGTGVAQMRLSGEGTLGRPVIHGTVEIGRLAWNGQENGQFSVGVDARDGRANLEWKGSFFGAELAGSGDLQLRDSFPFSARVGFRNMDLALLLPAVREFSTPVSGRAGGEVTLEGTLKNVQLVRVRGSLDALAASAGQVAFRNAEPVRFRYESGSWQVERLHLIAKDTDLEASGTVSAAREHALNFAVKGHADLGVLKALDPDLTSVGQVALDASLYGTLTNPLWRGQLDFSDAGLRYGSLPNGLSKLKGRLRFEGNRASLENVTAESGGGLVKLGGLVTWARENGLGLQIETVLSGVRVRYPEGVSTWLDGRLTWTGSPKSSLLAGRLQIAKETANPEFDIGNTLIGHKELPLARVRSTAMRNVRLDIGIVSSPNLSLETTTAKNLRGDVDLHIQGSIEHPSWLGRISILQGEITIGGRRYLADRGELTFSNPFRFEPILNLQVRARVEQYDIGLNFNGPLDRLTITYNSDPPLPTSEILALLVAGSSYATSFQPVTATTTPQIGAGSLLSQALNQQMGNRLDRIFGSGHIRFDLQTAGFDRPANANVAFEQHVSDNLTLLYVTNVTSAQQQIIQAELTLSPRFSVTAIRDQNGLVGVNFQIKLRFH